MTGFSRKQAEATPHELQDGAQDPNAPPAAFVHRIPDEGGDVILAPVVDALRAALRRRREQTADNPSTSVTEALTPDKPEADA